MDFFPPWEAGAYVAILPPRRDGDPNKAAAMVPSFYAHIIFFPSSAPQKVGYMLPYQLFHTMGTPRMHNGDPEKAGAM